LEEFKLIMSGTNTSLNKKAERDPDYFRRKTGRSMESEVLNAIREEVRGTSFSAEDIKLISGQSFPDIVAAYFSAPERKAYYGVEVKTTKEDKWTSIGSSIVETTRVPDVERIYLMFGKLGDKVEFMCRPYEECMSGIAVTHSPRYTIDMRLKDNESIFDKMGTTYDSFREDKDNIKKVRSFYLREAKEKGLNQMPWWMGDGIDAGVTLFCDLSKERKTILKTYIIILFDSVLVGNYKEAVLWLCSRLSVVNYNARDIFTAGGKCVEIDNVALDKPYPHIVRTILDYAPRIKEILDAPDEFITDEIEQYWGVVDYNHLFEQWIQRTENVFRLKSALSGIPIRSYILSGSRVTKLTE
jgi:hypothetical protein